MTLSKKSLTSIQNSYINMPKAKTNIINNKFQKIDKSKDDTKADSSGPKTYILEGGIIKVYVTDKNGVQKCVKQIPLEAAPLSILLQVKANSLSDVMMLQEAIDAKLKEEGASTSNYTSEGFTAEFNDD